MATSAIDLISASGEPLLLHCIRTMRRISEYRLPEALDRRLLWLSENKESLDDSQRDELLALVDLADSRGLEKVEAQVALAELEKVYPPIGNGNS